jgi:hypothetical protein
MIRPVHDGFGISSAVPPKLAVRAAGSVFLAALAAAIAWFGLRINAWYGDTLGKTAEASAMRSGLSISADVLALYQPRLACSRAIGNSQRLVSPGAPDAMTILIALLVAVGLAALNIADTTTARSKVTSESTLLTERIERLRSERAKITESRLVATIEVDL